MVSISVISETDSEVASLGTSNDEVDRSVLSNSTQAVEQTQNVVNSDVKQTTKSNLPPKTKTKVRVPPGLAVTYKKKGIFKVKIEDRYDDEISHAKIKVKIGTGSKAKTFSVKTNSYGVAKINTKSLKIGAHKVVIISNDDRYDIYKTSKIFVGKQYTKTIKSPSKKGNPVKKVTL